MSSGIARSSCARHEKGKHSKRAGSAWQIAMTATSSRRTYHIVPWIALGRITASGIGTRPSWVALYKESCRTCSRRHHGQKQPAIPRLLQRKLLSLLHSINSSCTKSRAEEIFTLVECTAWEARKSSQPSSNKQDTDPSQCRYTVLRYGTSRNAGLPHLRRRGWLWRRAAAAGLLPWRTFLPPTWRRDENCGTGGV